MKTTVSIVIRCYNEEKHIGKLLDGIFSQTVQDVEIIAVDSGSTDETLTILSQYPVAVLSIKPEEFSFGRSLNIGCRAARSDFIVAASAHVYPITRHWLEQLLAPFSNLRVALVYGKQTGNEVTKYSERQVFEQWFPHNSNPDQDHSFCNNANVAIRKTCWEQHHYDEHLTGLEDIDWARRAMATGYKIAYSAEAVVVHVHEESWTNIRNRYMREAMALKRIYPHEDFTLWDFIRLVVANTMTDCYCAWGEKALRRHLKSIVMFRFMQFLGTFRGFKRRDSVSYRLRRRLYYPVATTSSSHPSKTITISGHIEYGIPLNRGASLVAERLPSVNGISGHLQSLAPQVDSEGQGN